MKALRLKTHHFHTKVPCQKPMLRQIEWWLQNEPITKNRVLPVTTLFFWKFSFSLKTSYKNLIWCTNNLNTHICTFCKRWSFIWRCSFPVSILNKVAGFKVEYCEMFKNSFFNRAPSVAVSDANLEYPFWHLKTCLSRISWKSCKTLQSRKFKSYVICSCPFVFFFLFFSFFRLFICSYVFFLNFQLKTILRK